MGNAGRIIGLIAGVFTVAASAQTPTVPESMCAKAPALEAVKEVIHENFLGAITGKPITADLFLRATAIDRTMPIKWEAALKQATCQGTLSVDASAGFDPTVDQALQRAYATNPAALMRLPKAYSGPTDKRRYNMAIQYTVQPKNVMVQKPDELDAAMMFGHLKAMQDGAVKSSAAASVVARPATRSPQKDLEQIPIGEKSKSSIRACERSSEPLACETEEHDAADAALNAAYKTAMARLSPERKTKLRTDQRAWIKARDKECEDQMGHARLLACKTDWTATRTSEIQRY